MKARNKAMTKGDKMIRMTIKKNNNNSRSILRVTEVVNGGPKTALFLAWHL